MWINNRIEKWFKEYQPHLDETEWQILYKKLIKEELNETILALEQNNLVEFLDWCADLYWVIKWFFYFWWKIDDPICCDLNPFQILFDNIKFDWWELLKWDLVWDLINAIADSNFTKVYELQTEWEKIGKVIKWPNFVWPTEAIKEIIQKYNILFITDL